jgi:hypothetical protein
MKWSCCLIVTARRSAGSCTIRGRRVASCVHTLAVEELAHCPERVAEYDTAPRAAGAPAGTPGRLRSPRGWRWLRYL